MPFYPTALEIAEKVVASDGPVAICQAQMLEGVPPRKAPEVTEVLQGIRRTLGVAPNHKHSVLVEILRALVESMRKDDPGVYRDSCPTLPGRTLGACDCLNR